MSNRSLPSDRSHHERENRMRLPTLGGQTALNAAMELNRNGALTRHGVN